MLITPDPPINTLARELVENGGAFQNAGYVSGQKWSVKVDRVGSILRANLRLIGSLDTGATPGTPTPRVRNPIQLLGDEVTVKVSSKAELSAHPDLLLNRAQWRRGRYAVNLDSVTAVELADDASNPDFSLQLPLDFVPPNVMPDQVGIVNGPLCSDIEISGTWGDVGDVCITPGTVDVDAGQLSLFLDRTYPAYREKLNEQLGYGAYILDQVGEPISGDGTLKVELPGGRSFNALYFRAQTGSTPDASDNPYDEDGFIRVRRGSDILFEKSIEEIIANTVQGMPEDWDRRGILVVDFMKPELSESAVMMRGHLSDGNVPLRVEVDCLTSTGARLDIMTECAMSVEEASGQRYRGRGR